LPTPKYARQFDVSSPEFYKTGSWTNPTLDMSGYAYFGPNQWYANGAGSGSNFASWTLTDAPVGVPLKVYLTWNSRAPETLGDGTASTGTYVNVDPGDGVGFGSNVNQARVPVPTAGYPAYYDHVASGVGWKLIQTVSSADGWLTVSVSDFGATGKIWVDGLRVVDATLDQPCKTPAPFEDDFQDGVASTSWQAFGGTWGESGGIYRQTATGSSSRKARQYYQEWSRTHCEVLAKVRVDSWTDSNANSRAGVALNVNGSGQGYALTFDGRSASRDAIALVDDAWGWTAAAPFAWSTATWYWFRLRRSGGLLQGRVWAVGDAEPSTWACETTIGSPFLDRTDGYPALVGNAPSSFDDVAMSQFDGVTACSGVLTTQKSLSASGSVSMAPKTGTASPSRSKSTLSASASYSGPKSGSATNSKHPLLQSGGTFAPSRQGGLTRTIGHPAMGGAGSWASLTSAGTLAKSRHPEVAASGTRTAPVYSGDLDRATSPKALAGAAQNDNYMRHGSASPKAKKALAGVGTYKYTLQTTGVDLSHSPEVQAFGTGFMPAWAPVSIVGSEGWNDVGSIALAVSGHEPEEASIPLALPAVASTANAASIPLVVTSVGGLSASLGVALKGASWESLSHAVPLWTFGDGADSAFRQVPLSIRGSRARSSAALGLAIFGVDEGESRAALNLAIVGGGTPCSSSLPVFIASRPPVGRSLPIFLAAPPGTPGAIPVGQALNLYCEWGLQAVVPLVCGGFVADGSVPLAILGSQPLESSVDLRIVGEGGVSYGTADLCLPLVADLTAADASLDLALPGVLAALSARTNLFINGWRPS